MSDTNYVDGNTVVAIENMTSHKSGYTLDNGVRRRVPGNGRVNITAEEVRQAVYEHGNYIFVNTLRVTNAALAREIGVPEDMIEYNWTAKDIKDALTTSDIAIFLDALDFAPDGIKEEMLTQAVELEITDGVRKEALNKYFGVDIDAKIANKHAYDDAGDKAEETAAPSKRRASSSTAARKRRASAAKTE